MERWSGKVAIVTGASSGIGAAIAEALTQAGVKVVGLARRQEKLEELAKRLEKLGEFHWFKTDVGLESDIVDAFEWVKENVGPVHILVNNAGVGRPFSLIEGETEELKKVLDTNVLAVAVATREAVKIMRNNNVAGHIINMNSVCGHIVPNIPHMNIYPASKFAVTAMSETLRHEINVLQSNIKVTSISPGLVETEIFLSNGFLENPYVVEMMKILPKLQSKDIADAVLYALGTPPHVQITELIIRPLGEV